MIILASFTMRNAEEATARIDWFLPCVRSTIGRSAGGGLDLGNVCTMRSADGAYFVILT